MQFNKPFIYTYTYTGGTKGTLILHKQEFTKPVEVIQMHENYFISYYK